MKSLDFDFSWLNNVLGIVASIVVVIPTVLKVYKFAIIHKSKKTLNYELTEPASRSLLAMYCTTVCLVSASILQLFVLEKNESIVDAKIFLLSWSLAIFIGNILLRLN